MGDKKRLYLFYDIAISICSTCYRKVEAKIVFQDGGDGAGQSMWTANLDGTSLTKVATTCPIEPCTDQDPAFDPTGTKVVFVRTQQARASTFNGPTS